MKSKSVSDTLERYSRQILFSEVGSQGQQHLIESRVAIVGCGALGTVQAEILCRAGIGHLTLIDRDFVEKSNLQRQTLFNEQDAENSLPKAIAVKQHLNKINSLVDVEAQVVDLNYLNAESLMEGIDCILDGTDNFETRFLLNDISYKKRIPWIYGAAVGSSGLTMTIIPGQTPCFRCIMESLPLPGSTPTCDTAGILSPIASIVSSLQVTEAIKILTGKTTQINSKLLCLDIWKNSWQWLEIASSSKSHDCPVCHSGKLEFLKGNHSTSTTTLCGRDSVQIFQSEGKKVNLPELGRRLQLLGTVSFNRFLLRFKCKDAEIIVFLDGRSIVKGTSNHQLARSLYSRYIGN
ncbi:MAG: ThiF family adenylyltransferase [Acidobacteriia bacterium]|nr:ThiF family adenylyltransferase [Terriglobia bacterium]